MVLIVESSQAPGFDCQFSEAYEATNFLRDLHGMSTVLAYLCPKGPSTASDGPPKNWYLDHLDGFGTKSVLGRFGCV